MKEADFLTSSMDSDSLHIKVKNDGKNQGFNGIRICDSASANTGAMLYQLSYEATHWEQGQFIEFISPVRSEMMWSIYERIHIWITVVDQSEEWSSQ